MDLAGVQVTCPACSRPFTVPAPPKPNKTARIILPPAGDEPHLISQKWYWLVDARVLVVNAPPTYIQLMIEVPDTWALPMDANLPEPASQAIKAALSAKFPHCPSTPTKIRVADHGSLKRTSDPPDHSNASCRVWFLGSR